MAVETKPWVRADLERLPDDGNRYEVLDGRLLVTPQASRAHQRVALQLAIELDRYVSAHGVAHVVGPAAVPFGENELQPDVEVVPGLDLTAKWKHGPHPVLVVEVLSTSSRRYDRGIKLAAYLERVSVPTVWIVDHKRREVEVCERGAAPRVETEALRWLAPGAPAPLEIDLIAMFQSALGG